MHQKLKLIEAKQAHLSSMLHAEKQAHTAAVASLHQIQQGHSMDIRELNAKVMSLATVSA